MSLLVSPIFYMYAGLEVLDGTLAEATARRGSAATSKITFEY